MLLALEIAARVYVATRLGGKAGEQAVYAEFDPQLGWRKKPGAVAHYKRREYQTEVRINSKGLRGPEIDYATTAGTPRVLLLGDSFIEGYTVEENETVSSQLRVALRDSGCPTEVVNGGTHAYSTDQELLFYRGEGRKYGASVVVLFTFYNDVLWNTEARYYGSPKPLFAASDFSQPINTPLQEPPPKPAPTQAPARRPQSSGSALAGLLAERLFTGAPRAHRWLVEKGIFDEGEPDSVRDDLRIYRSRRANPVIDKAWDQTRGLIAELAREVKADGARFLVVHIPARFEISDRDWDLTVMRYNLNPEAWDRRRVATLTAAAAQDAGASFLDLTKDLRSGVSLLREPYFMYDGHWNALGHRIAGVATARTLLASHAIATCAASRNPTS